MAAATSSSNSASISSSKPILGYWKIRGLASSIRYQLIYSGVPFTEEVYEQGDGPDYSGDAWLSVKDQHIARKITQQEGGWLQYPNLPYFKDKLEDGTYTLTESGAIHRYCASKWCKELLHHDNIELYGKAEMVWGVYTDLKGFVTGPCYAGDGDKKKLTELALPKFELIARQLQLEGGNKYLIGDELCCADFAFVELVELMDFISDGKIYEVYPSLKVYRDGMFNLPRLKEYYEDKKKGEHVLPFNNKCAKINNL